MKNFIITIILLSFIGNASGINNLKETISLDQLKKLEKIEVKEVMLEPNSTQWVVSLTKGTVINEGGILTEKGYILEDTKTGWADQHGLMKEKRDLDSENPMYFKGNLAVISSPGSENWYHWLLQILPRLIILKESGVVYDRIYIHDLKYNWQICSLNAMLHSLNIPEDKLLVVNGDVILQASILVVPSVPFIPAKNYPAELPTWLKNRLRNLFLDSPLAQTGTYSKIYISRANASSRRIKNENELVDKLNRMGFKTIQLELLSPYDQAKLFNSSKVIIGPHGSGFANLIFTCPGCQLIEIDHGPLRSFYKQMSALMDCKYHPFYIDETASEEHWDEDMVVDIPKLLELVNTVFKNSGTL